LRDLGGLKVRSILERGNLAQLKGEMKTKYLAVAVIALVMAASANVFGDSLVLTGTGLDVTSASGSGILSFSDSNYEGGWSWGNGGSITIADGSTTISDEIESASVDPAGTFQVTVASTADGGLLVLSLLNPSLSQIDEAFTSPVNGGDFDDGGIDWIIGGGGTVSASDPGTVSASEPWNLQMSLVFFGIVAGLFGALIRKNVLRFVCLSQP
jgi:hypothetical protein